VALDLLSVGWCLMMRKALLASGVLAALLFVGMTFFLGLLWDGYSVVSQTPSELSAIGAPTRSLWMLLGAVYAVLMIAFGWALRRSPESKLALRVVGTLLMAQAAFGWFWPPMHQRDVLAAGGGTITDTLHLAWAVVTSVLFVVAIGFGAFAFGKRFRAYSMMTLAVLLVSGVWTGTFAPRIQANLPTPGVGIVERVNIVAFMSWIVVLAIVLLRKSGAPPVAA
jgi:hypothetical protein